MPRRLEVKIYKKVIWSIYLFSLEPETMKKEDVRSLEVSEIRRLRKDCLHLSEREGKK